MPEIPVLHAIAGGILMGLGVGVLLLGNGRIGGIGGSLHTVVTTRDLGTSAWRVLYLAGIVLGGTLAYVIFPAYFDMTQLNRPLALLVVSGVVMGFGGAMCNGCTSGHGVCGVARLSKRSLVATATFFGMTLLSMFVGRHVLEVF